MITTNVLTDEAPLDVLEKGTELIFKAVSVTMGPRGRNVIFRKYGKKVGVTHDGVTVANMVRSNVEAEQAAIEMVQEAAKKLDAVTGDGTTTVTVLTYHILKEAAKRIREGESPMKLKLAIEALQPVIVKEIENATDHDVTLEKLQAIASVAAGDKEIGASVGKIIFEAGKDTPIMLGFTESTETYSEVISGFKINSGAASPYFAEGSGIKQEIHNPMVVVVDAKMRDQDDIKPILALIAAQPAGQRDFLVVASDIAGDALSLLIINHLKGFAKISVARVPQHITSHSEYLADVAISCGAKVLSRNSGHTLREPELSDFGKCKKVTVEPLETVIINGQMIKEDFDTHVATLRDYKKTAKTAAGRKFADDRLKTLEQKVVSIFVGGQSDTEAEERHYRYEDAVGAARAALRGGIVPGGGTLLFSISANLLQRKTVAATILARALRAPLFKILDNAGVSADELIIDKDMGIDVMHPEEGVINLTRRGIVDPAQSEIECVKTAISIAGLLMSAGAEIIDEGEPDNEQTQFPTGLN